MFANGVGGGGDRIASVGRALVVGGINSSGSTIATSRIFDEGLNFANSRRPVITTATSPVALGGVLTLTGTQFRVDAEGSDGATNNSSSNYPVVHSIPYCEYREPEMSHNCYYVK